MRNPVAIDVDGVDYVGVVHNLQGMDWEIFGVNAIGNVRKFTLIPEVDAMQAETPGDGTLRVTLAEGDKVSIRFFIPRYDV